MLSFYRKYNISLSLNKSHTFHKKSQHDISLNFVLTSLLENVFFLIQKSLCFSYSVSMMNCFSLSFIQLFIQQTTTVYSQSHGLVLIEHRG